MIERAMYVNHLGRSVVLNGGGIHLSSEGLADWSIKHEAVNGRVTSFRREPKKITLAAVLAFGSGDDGLAKRNELYEAAVIDVEAEKPGRLYVGEWYITGYIVASRKDRYWYTGAAAEYEMEFVSARPLWTREHDYSYRSISREGVCLVYPHGYPYDYAAPSSVGVLDSPSALPAPARITVFGPASNPRVTIGGNRYEVAAEVPDGGLLIIDGLERKITVRTKHGIEENAFHLRVGKQKIGCGTFAFEPVPPGRSTVSWDGSFGFDAKVFEQRDERRWG